MNSRQNTQVITPSRLSHTSVLPSASFCHLQLSTHTGAPHLCNFFFLFLPHLTSYVIYIKNLNRLKYVFFVANNIFLRRTMFLRVKEFDSERTFTHKFTDFRDILSWLRQLLFLTFKLCRSSQFKVNFARRYTR